MTLIGLSKFKIKVEGIGLESSSWPFKMKKILFGFIRGYHIAHNLQQYYPNHRFKSSG